MTKYEKLAILQNRIKILENKTKTTPNLLNSLKREERNLKESL